jgi:hypothetical protein
MMDGFIDGVIDGIKIFIGNSISDVLTWIIIDERTNKFFCP